MKTHPSVEPLETRIAPATIFAINDSNGLFSFDSEMPGTISAIVGITGLMGGDFVKAIDFRPSTGQLYGITISGAGPFTGRLYTIDPATAAAELIAVSSFSTTLTTASGYGMDFNPAEDLIRITNLNEENLRLDPDSGSRVSTDPAITGATALSALAHTNNYPGATSTTLYGVNFNADDLVLVGGLNSNPPPEDGVVTKVGDITPGTDLNTQDRLGLDILTTLDGNTAFYSGRFSNEHRLYTWNLATGAATLIGAIGNGTTPVADIAVQPVAALTFASGKSFTYTDGDGDLVTVKTSAGTLQSSQFSWLASADGTRRELIEMNVLASFDFTGANLTFSAKKTAAGGDGRVDIGVINASVVNLGSVKVSGNLRGISAGTLDMVVPAVKSIDVLSFGLASGANDETSVRSDINGNLPLLKIKGDLLGGAIKVNGKGGTVFIGGSMIGTDAPGSGSIQIFGGAKSVLIGGSIVSGRHGGILAIDGQVGSVKIGGSIIGGSGSSSGSLLLSGPSGSVQIGGSIIGGGGNSSGQVFLADVGALKIGGSIVGSTGELSATLTFGKAPSVTIGGSIIGGTGERGGNVTAGIVGTFTLGGSISGGNPASKFSGGLHFTTAKSVLIKGNVTGQQGAPPALIGFAGKTAPATAAESIAVGGLRILGSVVNTHILLGESSPGIVDNVNAAAGKISIGGDFIASSISAGFETGADGSYGNTDVPAAMGTLPDIKAAIGSIIIKGRAGGTGSDGDHYGIVAEQLGSVMIAGRTIALNPAAQDNVLVGPFGDFRVREFAVP